MKHHLIVSINDECIVLYFLTCLILLIYSDLLGTEQ